MSLATRCTACGTIFRVVQDQLKVSEGWVRCGRCQEVFNALQNLFDLEREAPPPWPPVAADDWKSTLPVTEAEAAPEEAAASTPAADPAGLASQPLLHRPSAEQAVAFADEPEEEADPSGFADARFNLALLDDEPSRFARDAAGSAGGDTVADGPAHDDNPKAMPRFVRQAEREARWRRPGVRIGLSVLLLLLTLTLAGQLALHFRAQLVASMPETRALIDPLCAWKGCRIEAPRRLDSIVVDSTGLTRLDSPGLYRLSIVLRNRASTPVLLPAIDLSLTDAQGQLVSRRALSAAELGARQDQLAPGAELPLQALLASGERALMGYTVEIFYP
jgi:predicted Zn finger-like uncharacterized protein